MMVLICDDNESLRLLMATLIQRDLGYEVSEAADGMQAWQALDSGLAADLCVLDLRMPSLGGMELLARLRADRRFQQLKVLVCSSEDGRAKVLSALSFGLSGYLIKPFTAGEFVDKVRRLCEAAPIGNGDQPLEPMETALERLTIDSKTYLELLDLFTKEVAGVITDLRVCSEGISQQEIETRLVGLRGSGRTLGANALVAELLRLQALQVNGQEVQPATIELYLESLERINKDLIAEIDAADILLKRSESPP
jgi:two-component system chemotaxis response regulator CheY